MSTIKEESGSEGTADVVAELVDVEAATKVRTNTSAESFESWLSARLRDPTTRSIELSSLMVASGEPSTI